MKTATPINRHLFNIFLLFTREPFVQYFSKELEYYSNGNGGLLGLISLDLTDNDYYGCILSRDKSMQYRAEKIIASLPTIEEARNWIDEQMSNDSITSHDNKFEYFDLFKELNNESKQHPNFKILKSQEFLSSAKEAISEISYHYKDIDGNFVEQFQTLNGFDSRVWELFLFCFFREQFFSFKRNFHAPDYIIEKFDREIAVEAVIVSRKTDLQNEAPAYDEVQKKLENETPLLYGSALISKLNKVDKDGKKYWEQDHVKGKPFLFAIADFHDTMSMTWSYNALLDYLYGYKYEHSFDEKGELIIKPIKIENYKKPNGTEIPSGFFFQPETENISAIIFSSCGTLSKFNRMGKQAKMGSDIPILIRVGAFYNHTPNADKPNMIHYIVDENSQETWSEGVVVFHNPNAKTPLNPAFFDDKVAQTFFEDEQIYSVMPKVFPYYSFTQNMIPKNEKK